MPDITMCNNHDCPLANKCYRHEAEPDSWQSYSNFKPDENGKCGYYLEIKDE